MQFVIYFCLLSTIVFAQLPKTEVYLFDIKCSGKTITVLNGKNISNHPGYDNQPFFHPDNDELFFVSLRENNQTDIYLHQIKKNKNIPFTQTPISEYSPMITPDGEFISTVVVEADSTQKIYQYDVKRKFAGKDLTDEDSIGYYCWLSKDSLLLYKLTSPHGLYSFDLTTKQSVRLADLPAHSFFSMDKFRFLYCIPYKDSSEVRIFNTQIKKSERLTLTAKENQDFFYLAFLGVLKSEGTKLFRYDNDFQLWVELLDLKKFISSKITRFTFSKNKKYLAVVVQEE